MTAKAAFMSFPKMTIELCWFMLRNRIHSEFTSSLQKSSFMPIRMYDKDDFMTTPCQASGEGLFFGSETPEHVRGIPCAEL